MIRPRTYRILLSIVAAVFSLSAHAAWNNPYPSADRDRNILYAAFRERPKHLDPARSYSSNEYEFIAQVYEPPFQYHYLKRPYALAPLTAVAVPKPVYLDRQGRRLPQDAPAQTISYSVYEIRIRPGVYYQPHPAFARDDKGDLRYQALTERELGGVYAISDFSKAGTRELVAADYVYQIKRLAHPKLHSPILSVMQDYIVGLKDYVATLKRAHAEVAQGREEGVYLDLTRYPLAGVEAVDLWGDRALPVEVGGGDREAAAQQVVVERLVKVSSEGQELARRAGDLRGGRKLRGAECGDGRKVPGLAMA